MDSRTAFITGATSGIGYATAKLFAKEGINLVLCGRNRENLNKAKEEFEKQVMVKIISFDVSNRKEVFEAIDSLPEEWKEKISILVNNAGNAHGLDSFEKGSLDDFDAMISSNITGVLNVTKAILPFFIKNQQGKAHIVNLSSIAGKEVYPKGTVYCATKHAMEALSQGMRMDFLSYGIKVTNIAPGAVETNFSKVRFKGDQEKSDQVYKGYTPLIAEDIADAIYFAISRPAHVQIADMTILPKAQASTTLFHKN